MVEMEERDTKRLIFFVVFMLIVSALYCGYFLYLRPPFTAEEMEHYFFEDGRSRPTVEWWEWWAERIKK